MLGSRSFGQNLCRVKKTTVGLLIPTNETWKEKTGFILLVFGVLSGWSEAFQMVGDSRLLIRCLGVVGGFWRLCFF